MYFLLKAARTSKRCIGSHTFTQDQGEGKGLRAGGSASEKERLGVPATLPHCSPLEAHLSLAVGQQGAEA